MPDRTSDSPAADVKAELRSEMRALRRALPERDSRSEQLWRNLIAVPEMVLADNVLAFTSVAGEPATQSLLAWCAATGRLAAVPESDVDPAWPDVVVVPGLAFTADGHRLGQGGGWYDRFLTGLRPDCTTIGVCFAEQILETLPVEVHDVAVNRVVTDERIVR